MIKKTDDEKPSKSGKTQLAFDPVQAALRQLYEDVAAEQIPDDFIKLLDQLDEPTIKAGKK